MKLNSKTLNNGQPYKSIKHLTTPATLPNFTLITGHNGAGKTHLLEAIHQQALEAYDHQDNPLTPKYFNYTDLIKQVTDSTQPNAFRTPNLDQQKTLWQLLETAINDIKKRILDLSGLSQGKNTVINYLGPSVNDDIFDMMRGHDSEAIHNYPPANGQFSTVNNQSFRQIFQEFDTLYENSNSLIIDQIKAVIEAQDLQAAQAAKRQTPQQKKATPYQPNPTQQLISIYERQKINLETIFKGISENANKKLIDCTNQDLNDHFPDEMPTSPFQRALPDWINSYLTEWDKNAQRRDKQTYLNRQDITYLEDAAFKQKYGDFPWEQMNQMFKIANLPFTLTPPKSMRPDQGYRATIAHNQSGDTIGFNELSSGEKVIMSLSIALSYDQKANRLKTLPNLLLLDETDAFLHPRMNKTLLDVITNNIIEKYKINVMMTTHSPTTVALAPDDAIHYLSRDNNKTTLTKQNKEQILQQLTYGVPTLSIDYDKRIVVFTESEKDAEIYKDIFEQLKKINADKPHPEEIFNNTSLIFTSFDKKETRSQNGGADKIKKLIPQLSNEGLNKVKGIIDWDKNKEHKTEGNIYVIAQNQRYTLENSLLDPIITGYIAIQHYGYEPKDFAIEHPIDFDQQEHLQELANAIIQEMGITEEEQRNKETCHYENKHQLELPIKFLHADKKNEMNDFYKNLTNFSSRINAQENRNVTNLNLENLSKDIKKHVIKNNPDLLPTTFRHVFEKIAQTTTSQ